MEAFNGKIYIFPCEGNSDEVSDFVKECDPSNNKWQDIDETCGREGFATTVCNGGIYFIDNTTVVKYTPKTN